MLRLRTERQRRGWSLTQLTALTSIATSDLSSLERGLRPAYPGWRRRIARAFRLPEEELFAEQKPEEAA
jgi:transcriptional regulator with XRE-family HTH domain